MTEYGRKHTDGSRSGGQPPAGDLKAQLRTNFYAQCKEFADRIAALEVENGRLREALEESLALNINYHAVEEQDGYQFTEAPAVIEAARAALGEKP